MNSSFRDSMNMLHTWAGVIIGALLFAIFWTGTLTVFVREIDRWMIPVTRLENAIPPVSFDNLRASYDGAVAQHAPNWSIRMPTDRQPIIRLFHRGNAGSVLQYLNPSTGEVLPDFGSWGASQFLYPFHYNLNIRVWRIGYWIVGLAGMMMLVLCVSGVLIHRKLLTEFFTFRSTKRSRRMLLDLHNVTGVIGLPFHFVITLSGLIIFFSMYLPSGWQTAYSSSRLLNEESFGMYSRPKLNRPGPLASLDGMAAEARRIWGSDEIASIIVRHPGDAAAYVAINRAANDSVALARETAYFNAADGALLKLSTPLRPVASAQNFIAGMHFTHFRHWTLRWTYFFLGLVGCIMILTGYLFWLESRRRKHEQRQLSGVRLVEAIATASTLGIVIATLAFFVANRLLPNGLTVFGIQRAALEAWVFYLVWLATLAQAMSRPRLSWIDQCNMIAGMAVMAVALNWITTGDNLFKSLINPHLWGVAGVDIMLLSGAAVAGIAANRVRRRLMASPDIRGGRMPVLNTGPAE